MVSPTLFRPRASSQRKNGAPSTAVRMPSGVSMRARLRPSVSTSSMNEAPSSIAAGSSRSKFGPTIMRAMCGIIRPIQPITPEIATTLAVISVAAAITMMRSRGTSTPSARASSSPSESTPMRQRNRMSGTRPTSTSGSDDREIGELHAGEAAEQPERDRGKLVVRVGQDLHQRDAGAGERADHDAGEHQHQGAVMAVQRGGDQIDQRHRAEPEQRRRAPGCRATGSDSRMPSTAPSPAPVETPRMSGETSGLRNSV